MMYTMSQAKHDHKTGYLTSFVIHRHSGGGWTIVLGSGMAAGSVVDARDKQVRVFVSLDSVIAFVEKVGFEVNELRL